MKRYLNDCLGEFRIRTHGLAQARENFGELIGVVAVFGLWLMFTFCPTQRHGYRVAGSVVLCETESLRWIQRRNVLPTTRIGVVLNLNNPGIVVECVRSYQRNAINQRLGLVFGFSICTCSVLVYVHWVSDVLLVNDVLLRWCFCWDWKVSAATQFLGFLWGFEIICWCWYAA